MPNETATAPGAAQTAGDLQRAPLSAGRSLVVRIAQRFSVDPDKLMTTLKATAFRQLPDRQGNIVEPTNEEMMALLILADGYGLNPFTRELFAFRDPKSGAIVPVVSVDGWIRIIQSQPTLRSVEFRYSTETVEHKGKTCHAWIECEIVRADRAKPMVVREYFAEVVRAVDYATPWDTHPNRMHRHKTLIQGGRYAFGFGGIYDEDEATRIIEGEAHRVDETAGSLASINARILEGPGATTTSIPGVVGANAPTPAAVMKASDAPLDPPKASAKPRPSAPAFTFAEVAEKIARAANVDQLADAVSLIDAVAIPGQRDELLALAEQRESAIDGGKA